MESLKEDREEEAGECLLAKDEATEEEEETTGEKMAEEHHHQKKRANDKEEDEEQASSCEHRRRRTKKPNKALQLTVNFSVVIGVAVSWACATQFRRSTMVVDTAHFYAPYAMVWFSTSFMLLCYPVFLLYVLCAGKLPLLAEHTKALEMFANQRGQGQSGGFSFRTFLWRVLLFLGLWTVINYAYAQSLGLISASAAASIMSANTAAVCLLGWAMLKEPFNAVKTLAVLFAIAGVIVVSLDAEFAGNPLGIALAVLSAACAAFYKVLFKLVHGSATLGQVSLFMSALGALNLVANAVPTLLLVYYGLDRLQWAHIPWAPLLGSAVLGLVFNFLVNFGIVLLDPLVISVGMIFGLPLSAVIDLLFRSMTASPEFVAGSTLISISFLLIAFPVDKALRRLCGGRREAKDDVEKDEQEEGAKQKQKRSPNPID